MFPKQNFKLKESSTSITKPVTKFGGQPIWINTPQWPLYTYSTKPQKMLFMGQIVLDVALFSGSEEMIAYIFFWEEGEPLSEEQMVIVLQTQNDSHLNKPLSSDLDIIAFEEDITGPTVFELDAKHQKMLKEYQVLLEPLQMEDKLSLGKHLKYTWNDDPPHYSFIDTKLGGNKIGGQPVFFSTTYPKPYNPDEWYLLLQMMPKKENCYSFPFFIGVYPLSIIQIFVSKDFKKTVAVFPTI
ncbi:hypothetical protein BKI52_10070 [marine bacterium AO1-C]|nr:hypothetical protein BKI52_10070 [marine bacterium AO1-C]